MIDLYQAKEVRMNHRFLLRLRSLVGALAVLTLMPSLAAGQASSSTAKVWTPPRTPDGQPDLQGIWTSATLTPLERPADLAGKPFLTETEAAEYEKRLLEQGNRDRRGASAELDVGGAYNEFWFERGNKVVGTRRTSLIVDPPDGRIPALTPGAQKKAAARADYRRVHPADGPEDLGLAVRCILWPTAGPPMLPGGYNNNYRIVQAPGYVVILVEMIHDARVIPIDTRPHLPQNIRQWMGDSRGHWEGDTLVVETTNFTEKTNFRGAGENLRVIERFTRADPETLLYEFTVDDPASFTKQWNAQLPMRRSDGPLFEYACHEGNYGLEGILKGARVEEDAAKKGGSK
jgi:hypothetical protein